eukprot:3256207-Prymnesium_polylepis.1
MCPHPAPASHDPSDHMTHEHPRTHKSSDGVTHEHPRTHKPSDGVNVKSSTTEKGNNQDGVRKGPPAALTRKASDARAPPPTQPLAPTPVKS